MGKFILQRGEMGPILAAHLQYLMSTPRCIIGVLSIENSFNWWCYPSVKYTYSPAKCVCNPIISILPGSNTSWELNLEQNDYHLKSMTLYHSPVKIAWSIVIIVPVKFLETDHAALFEINVPRSRNLLHRCYGRVKYAPYAMPCTTFYASQANLFFFYGPIASF